MSIRIRTVDGVRVALCAARSMPKPGDTYLDDADHYALTAKFSIEAEGDKSSFANDVRARLMEQEESNNSNRSSWDRRFGPSDRWSWPEDGVDEQCRCDRCRAWFIGARERTVCRSCAADMQPLATPRPTGPER